MSARMSGIFDNIQRAAKFAYGKRIAARWRYADQSTMMHQMRYGKAWHRLALIAALSLSLSACALHWPWKRPPPPPPQPVHQLSIAPDATGPVSTITQYWDRNTLLLDLTAVGGEGAAILTPIAASGWPVRLEFRVQPGNFARLEVLGAQRVVFAVPSQGAPLLLHLAPGAYHADTGQITVRWSAADDSAH
jgi:hypothetical protein